MAKKTAQHSPNVGTPLPTATAGNRGSVRGVASEAPTTPDRLYWSRQKADGAYEYAEFQFRDSVIEMTLGPFFINDLPATANTDAQVGFFNTASAVSLNANKPRVGKAGRVVGALVLADDVRTAGTATLEVLVSGVSSAFNSGSVQLNATNTASDSDFVEFASGVAFAAANQVSPRIVTASWAPTTANLTIWLVLQIQL